jgi:predicted PurR-regulated permease PerM
MLLERKALKKIMYQSLPRTWSIFLAEREEKILAALGAWIWGQCILSVIMASLVFVGLHAINFFFGIHMERIFPLAILTGMMEFIPYIGPLIAILPALALASSIGINATLIILVFYIIIQQLENHFIVPYVMSRTLQISPLLVFVTVLIGAELAGVIGIILAVPVAGMIRIFTEHLYQAKARK